MRPPLFATKPFAPVLWAGMGLVLLGLAPAVGRADMILGNLGAPNGSSVSIDSTDLYAASFTMGSQAYSLSDAQITLTFSPPSSTTFELESDSAGQPSGTVLSTFDNPILLSGLRTYTFTPDSPFTLAANTTYWLVGSTTDSSTTDWVASAPATNPTGSGATFGSYASSSDAGATWNASFPTTQFQLDGAAIPEPSSLFLTGTGICVVATVGLLRRRTRRP
jgi:hypothetical protein